MFTRILDAPRESALLLGPRATGKSTWLLQRFPDAIRYDLLDTSLALRLAREPGVLARELAVESPERWVIIDEIQKVPALLDEVHRLMENQGFKFLLSGSSARKLKRGGANLLAGRALRHDFFPLVSAEIGGAPPIERIPFGLLPRAYSIERPRAYLQTYCDTYVHEEVQAEALIRNVGAFSRFLEIAARQNGQVTNVSNISRDAQVARQTVQSFFDILVDTLIGSWLPAWRPRRQTRVVAHPKFFFFDPGVARCLTGRLPYPPSPEELGSLFETYLLHELKAWLSYNGPGYPLSYFRTHDQVEVDFLFESAGGHIAIEVKSSTTWRKDQNKGFARLREELDHVRCFGVYAGDQALKFDGIEVLPYARFLEMLWQGQVAT